MANRSTPTSTPRPDAPHGAPDNEPQAPNDVALSPAPSSSLGASTRACGSPQAAGSVPATDKPVGAPHDEEGESLLESVENGALTTADILRGLILRARMPWLLRHHQRRVVLAIFSVLMGAISLATISVVALITHSPFVFPSLGPAAYLFFYRPGSAAASPRNALTGCAVGILAGYVALLVTGLVGAPPASLEGVTWPRVLAVALAFSLTTAALIVLDVAHPPALATTLVVALGAFVQPLSLLPLYGGIVLLTAEAVIINRAAGLPYPLWHAHPRAFQRALGSGLTRSAYTSSNPSQNPTTDA